MRTLQLTAVFLISSLAFAQNAADDPGGWTKAKWGLTDAEIKAAFPQATKIVDVQDGGRVYLGLPSYVIDHGKYVVEFMFDKLNRLNYVELIDQKVHAKDDGTEHSRVDCDNCASYAGHVGTAAEEAHIKAGLNALAASIAKDSLLSGLTEKYGKPTTHSKDGNLEDFEWLFPTTKIILTWSHSQFEQLDKVWLFYKAAKHSPDL